MSEDRGYGAIAGLAACVRLRQLCRGSSSCGGETFQAAGDALNLGKRFYEVFCTPLPFVCCPQAAVSPFLGKRQDWPPSGEEREPEEG